jgi:hypothetical protein
MTVLRDLLARNASSSARPPSSPAHDRHVPGLVYDVGTGLVRVVTGDD